MSALNVNWKAIAMVLLEKPGKWDFWIFIGKVLFIKALILAFCYFVSQAGPACSM